VDQHDFDELTASNVSSSDSRRRLLRGLLAAAVAGAIALVRPGGAVDAREADAEAARRRRNKRRNRRRRNRDRPPAPQSDPRCPANKPVVTNEVCPSSPEINCAGPTSICARATNGTRQCVDQFNAPCFTSDCARDADCPADSACVEFGACCGAGPVTVCMPRIPITS